MQFMQLIRGGQNPQKLVIDLLQNQMGNTPMGKNLLELAKNNQTSEIEKIARNLMSQQGLDFDKEFLAFKQNLGIK